MASLREKWEKENGYQPWRYSEQEYVDYLEGRIYKLENDIKHLKKLQLKLNQK